jgi:hypothetical protein
MREDKRAFHSTVESDSPHEGQERRTREKKGSLDCLKADHHLEVR